MITFGGLCTVENVTRCRLWMMASGPDAEADRFRDPAPGTRARCPEVPRRTGWRQGTAGRASGPATNQRSADRGMGAGWAIPGGWPGMAYGNFATVTDALRLLGNLLTESSTAIAMNLNFLRPFHFLFGLPGAFTLLTVQAAGFRREPGTSRSD